MHVTENDYDLLLISIDDAALLLLRLIVPIPKHLSKCEAYRKLLPTFC